MINRTQALAHNDTKDREVAKDFLEQNKWYGITMGGEYDLDLEVHKFNRGCDIEMINYGMDRFEKHNHFRIPVRKQKYWSNLDTYNDKNNLARINKYKEWYIDYIQFLNNDLTELLWYNWKTIKHYKDNLYIDNTLTKQWSERERTFITIPYNYIKEFSGIKHYKLINGLWTRQIN
jgi:hypothetical protein